MDDDFNDLQRLLRLKRHEVPPPEFFEDFMAEFHHRQRAELLRRPLWRLALDRLEGAWPVFPVARYAYAGSCAVAVVAAGLTTAQVMSVPAAPLVASTNAQPTKTASPVIQWQDSAVYPDPTGTQVAAVPARMDLRSLRRPVVISPDLDFNDSVRPGVVPASAINRPRYVLDAQPVSYEQSSVF